MAQIFKKDRITEMSWKEIERGVKFQYFSPAYSMITLEICMQCTRAQGQDIRCIINDYGQIEQFRFPIHSTLPIKIFTQGFDDLD